jgi:hypothetical protein
MSIVSREQLLTVFVVESCRTCNFMDTGDVEFDTRFALVVELVRVIRCGVARTIDFFHIGCLLRERRHSAHHCRTRKQRRMTLFHCSDVQVR